MKSVSAYIIEAKKKQRPKKKTGKIIKGGLHSTKLWIKTELN